MRGGTQGPTPNSDRHTNNSLTDSPRTPHRFPREGPQLVFDGSSGHTRDVGVTATLISLHGDATLLPRQGNQNFEARKWRGRGEVHGHRIIGPDWVAELQRCPDFVPWSGFRANLGEEMGRTLPGWTHPPLSVSLLKQPQTARAHGSVNGAGHRVRVAAAKWAPLVSAGAHRSRVERRSIAVGRRCSLWAQYRISYFYFLFLLFFSGFFFLSFF